MQRQSYSSIDLMKYICAILVIMVHTAPLLPYHKEANWYLMTLLGRFCVPFFFISTGYFVFSKMQTQKENYIKQYLLGLLKIYLFWSVLYLPLGMHYIATEYSISYVWYPLVLLFAFFYIGTYFHLWFVPALLLSILLVYWFTKHFKKRYLLSISLILLLFGSIETYYGYINLPLLKDFFDVYIRIFFTTRNGLFFGLFYVAWGHFLAQKDAWIYRIQATRLLTFVFFLAMILEAYWIHDSANLDSNILLMAAPFTICLFLACLRHPIPFSLPYATLREYSSYYYFIHAYFLFLIPLFFKLFHLSDIYLRHGLFRFLSVLFCTHLTTMLIRKIKKAP